MYRKQAAKGNVLYEQVLQKNFQIIETFLNKFPLIFKKQQIFEQSLKKSFEKIQIQEDERTKVQEQFQMITNMLDKKINAIKQNSKNRVSQRSSQQHTNEERRTSFMRINSNFKENHSQMQGHSHSSTGISKEMIHELNKSNQENVQKFKQVESEISLMKEKLGFLSKFSGNLSEDLDQIKQKKVNTKDFDKLQEIFQTKIKQVIQQKVQQKYQTASEDINQKFISINQQLSNNTKNQISILKKTLNQQINKKISISNFQSEMNQVKRVVERIVTQSISEFATKQEIKKQFLLFEKKFIRLDLLTGQLMKESFGKTQQNNNLPFIESENFNIASKKIRKEISKICDQTNSNKKNTNSQFNNTCK